MMCDGSLRYTQQCQVRGWLDSLPPATGTAVALVLVGLFVALMAIGAVIAIRQAGRK